MKLFSSEKTTHCHFLSHFMCIRQDPKLIFFRTSLSGATFCLWNYTLHSSHACWNITFKFNLCRRVLRIGCCSKSIIFVGIYTFNALFHISRLDLRIKNWTTQFGFFFCFYINNLSDLWLHGWIRRNANDIKTLDKDKYLGFL